jgi:hypothetical protein
MAEIRVVELIIGMGEAACSDDNHRPDRGLDAAMCHGPFCDIKMQASYRRGH